MGSSGTVVGVVGARGGVGATTLAAGLAQVVATREGHGRGRGAWQDDGGSSGRRRADPPTGPRGGADPVSPGGVVAPAVRRGAAVLVDLDFAAAGIDVHLGIEDVAGLRWPDLAGARGEVPGDELTSLLPTWCGVPVLSGDRWRPGPAPPQVVGDVLDALQGWHRTVVLDLGRAEALAGGPGPRRCTSVLVVSAPDLRSVAGVVALRGALRSAVPDVRLVLRDPGPGGLGGLEVAHVVDLPVAAAVHRDRRLPAVVERGLGPVVPRRGRRARVVRRLAETVS